VDCDRCFGAGGFSLYRRLSQPQRYRPVSVQFARLEPFGHVVGVGDRAVSDRLLRAAWDGTVRPRDGETVR
jgi:hypothetical protein